ncbi:hypothetical protein [Nonlabens xiamenensis]|uniref:hypothetical protein n=1 Tax=Nonlabens xiamenensis TaxID=2341043 RepID=UPI000F614C28|nr:hypothetical protein [Nonlabens xiamenensis]
MRNLILIIIGLFSLSVQGQYDPVENIQLGAEFKGKGKWNDIVFNIPSKDGKIYSVSKRSGRGNKMVIDVFDSNMNHQSQYYIKGEKDEEYVAGKFIDGQLKFVAIDSDQGIGTLYKVDFKNEAFVKDRIIFDYSDQNIQKPAWGPIIFNYGVEKKDLDTGGYFKASTSNNYYLYSTAIKVGDHEGEEHQMVVLDSDFNILYTHTLKKELKDYLYVVKSIDINDSNGSVFLTSKVYEGNKRKESKRNKAKDKEANFHLEISLVNAQGDFAYSFGNEKFFIQEIASDVLDGKLVVGGYYGEKKTDGIKGVYMGLFDGQTLEKRNSNLTPFTDGIVSEIHDANERRTKRLKRSESSELKAKDIFISQDGYIYLIGEEDYVRVVERQSFQNGMMRKHYTHHFNDIALSQFSPEGKYMTTKLILKEQAQSSAPADFHSYYAFVSENNLNIFLNAKEQEDETDLSLAFKGGHEKRLSLFHIQMDTSGTLHHKEVISAKKTGSYAMSIRNACKLDLRSFIVDGNDGRTKRFVKIKL